MNPRQATQGYHSQPPSRQCVNVKLLSAVAYIFENLEENVHLTNSVGPLHVCCCSTISTNQLKATRNLGAGGGGAISIEQASPQITGTRFWVQRRSHTHTHTLSLSRTHSQTLAQEWLQESPVKIKNLSNIFVATQWQNFCVRNKLVKIIEKCDGIKINNGNNESWSQNAWPSVEPTYLESKWRNV